MACSPSFPRRMRQLRFCNFRIFSHSCPCWLSSNRHPDWKFGYHVRYHWIMGLIFNDVNLFCWREGLVWRQYLYLHAIFGLEYVHCSIEILYIVVRPILLPGWKILFEWCGLISRIVVKMASRRLFGCSSFLIWSRFFFLLLCFSSCIYYSPMIKIDKALNVSVFFSGAKLLLLGVSCWNKKCHDAYSVVYVLLERRREFKMYIKHK